MMDRHSLPRLGGCPLGLVLAFILSPIGASATETDNFFLPLEPQLADLGDFLEAMHTRAIEESVRQVNNRIEGALNLKDPAPRACRLASYHRPDALAEALASQFGDPPSEVPRIERPLRGAWGRQTFPNQLAIYRDASMNARGHFPMDPRVLGTIANSGTVRAYGVHFGTDKLLHFHQLGYDYYRRYRALLREGSSPEDACRKVIEHFSKGAFFAEKNFFGTIISGIYSNGDMAANYAGFKFFLNLTEKSVVKGQECEPLVIRCGVFWRVNDHVRPLSGWLRVFISDHWNEALNPNLYDWTMRPRIYRILQSRASHIVEFYTAKDGRPSDPTYFENLTHTLATYYGDAYGHSGQFEKLMHIGNVCFPALTGSSDFPFHRP